MAVVILVAGRGTRFRDDKPKCLSLIDDQTLLEWTVSLIRDADERIPICIVAGYKSSAIEEIVNKMEFKDVSTIVNEDYEFDQNILSAQMGMADKESDVLVLEGDCIYNGLSMKEFVDSIGSNCNTIFTIGQAEEERKNAILRSDENGFLQGYNIGERTENIIPEEWSNMAGAVLFSIDDLKGIMTWLERSGANPSQTYYFQPLTEIGEYQVIVRKLSPGAAFSTFNTQKQYLEVMSKMGLDTRIKLVETSSLRHVEGYSDKRVKWLKEKIHSEGIWNKPICIDSEHGIVMDGQHRMEVAKELGLSIVPSIGFKHSEVDFWSLRPNNHEVTLELIMSKSLSGNIYPYKTVKYSFPTEIPGCAINLGELV